MLTRSLFKKYQELFYKHSGIALKDYKQYLVEYRLQKFVGKGKRFANYSELYQAVKNDRDPDLVIDFIDVLTTNYTFFFREPEHFNFLSYYLAKNLRTKNYIRLWSAGCATGEEAYSMAITARQHIPYNNTDFKILATDISNRALRSAYRAEYPLEKVVKSIKPALVNKFFTQNEQANIATPNQEIKELITFGNISLMDPYPFKKKFDVVFLRNVLIYFEAQEKEYILNKISEVIKVGGFLITGLAESLIGLKHSLNQLKYSIYRKDK